MAQRSGARANGPSYFSNRYRDTVTVIAFRKSPLAVWLSGGRRSVAGQAGRSRAGSFAAVGDGVGDRGRPSIVG